MIMKIYTSYFAINGTNPSAKAISVTVPKFFKGPRLRRLAPNGVILRGLKMDLITLKSYFKIYRSYLENNISDEYIQKNIHNGDILLCWEKDESMCHRSVLAEFLRERGVEVEETHERLNPDVQTFNLFD